GVGFVYKRQVQWATTSQTDDGGLERAVRAAERGDRAVGGHPIPPDFTVPPPAFTYPETAIWSDATYNLDAAARAQVARTLAEPAEAQGLQSAGYVEVRAQMLAVIPSDGPMQYTASTDAQCSLRVRDPQRRSSGWAGRSSYDWARIDAPALAARALDKCIAARDPVAVEPGRYTVILEPQAVHDLVQLLVRRPPGLIRSVAESGGGLFAAGYDDALRLWRTKLGLPVVDRRITIDYDPADPDLGVEPFVGGDRNREPVRAVTWIDHGVLTTLSYDREYALAMLNENRGAPNAGAYRMSGGTTSIAEMIRSTARGLVITHFSDVRVLDVRTLLATGLTRDGVWLVEHGKVSKAVKNFRFTESPFVVLNNVEALGTPVPVFSPGTPAIVPPLMVRDFSFTALIDAV
ncbi:MAG: TldD/PmbA family protein, partial [Gemmatimonadaceae bacterium]|nr:TldD/PmbA family protein [Gemmatimonadaceae bacterium]